MGEVRRSTGFQQVVGDRILLELKRLGNATARQLAEQLNDVSATSLYRVLRKLCEQGRVVVLEERKARALTEKVYALSDTANAMPEYKALRNTSYLQAASSYYTGVLDGLRQHSLYSERDPEEDGAYFLALPASLSREEAFALAEKVTDAIAEVCGNEARTGRKLLSVSFLVTPAIHQAYDENSPPTSHPK